MDTNVLYAGLYSSKGASYQILRALEQELFQLALSTTLLFEYEDVLKRDPEKIGLSTSQINALLDDLCYRSHHQSIYFLWRPQLSDPKDDHILELAVASQTLTIVTFNIRDFRKSTQFGITTLTPQQFLETLK